MARLGVGPWLEALEPRVLLSGVALEVNEAELLGAAALLAPAGPPQAPMSHQEGGGSELLAGAEHIHYRLYAGHFETITGEWNPWYRDGEWLRATHFDNDSTAGHGLTAGKSGTYHVWVRIRNIGFHEPYRIDVTNQSNDLIRFDRTQQSYPADGEHQAAWVKIGEIPMAFGERMDFLISFLGYINPGTDRGIHAFDITTDPDYVPSGPGDPTAPPPVLAVDEPVGAASRGTLGLTLWHLGHDAAAIADFHAYVAGRGHSWESLLPASALTPPDTSRRLLVEPELLPPEQRHGWTVSGDGQYLTSTVFDEGPTVEFPLSVDRDGLYRLWVQFFGWTDGTGLTRVRIYPQGQEHEAPIYEDEIYDQAAATQGPQWKDALVDLEAGQYTVRLSHVIRRAWHVGDGPAGYRERWIDALYLTDEIWAAPPDAAAREAMRNTGPPQGIQWTIHHTMSQAEKDQWRTWALRPLSWEDRLELPALFELSRDFWRQKVDAAAALDYVGGPLPDYRLDQRQVIFDDAWNLAGNPVLVGRQIEALEGDVTTSPSPYDHYRIHAGQLDVVTGQWYRDGEWLRGPYLDHFGDYASHSLPVSSAGEHHVWVRIGNIGYHEPYRIDVANQSSGLIRFDRTQQSYPPDGNDQAAWVKIGVLTMGAGEPMDFLITPLGYINPGTYRGIHAFQITTDPDYVPSGSVQPAMTLQQYLSQAQALGGDLEKGYMAWAPADPFDPLGHMSWPGQAIPARIEEDVALARDAWASQAVFLRSLSQEPITLDVHAGPLVGDAGVFEGKVSWRVNAFSPYGEGREDWTPFLLMARPDLTVPPLNVAGLWLTVDSTGVPPGDYIAQVTLRGHNLAEQTVQLNVRVSPVRINPHQPILASGWTPPPEGERYLQDFADHGLNVWHDEMSAADMDRWGIELLYLPNWDSNATVIAERLARLAALGVSHDQFVMAVMDEPHGSTAQELQPFIDIASAIKQQDPNANVIFNPGETATVQTFEVLEPYADWWNPYIIHLGNPQKVELFSAYPYLYYTTPVYWDKHPSLPLWMYEQFREVPGRPGDVRGTAFFAFNYPFRDHWDTAYEFLPDAGVTVLPSRHGPVATRAWEAVRDGIQHGNLAQMVKEHPAAASDPAAQALITGGSVAELLDWLEAHPYQHHRLYAGYFETITGQWYADGEWLRGPYWDHFGDYASDSLTVGLDGDYHVWVRIRNIGFHEPYRIDVTNQSNNLIRFDRVEQSYPPDGSDQAAWVKIGVIGMDAGERMDLLITPLDYINPGTYRGIHAFQITTDPYFVPAGPDDPTEYQQQVLYAGDFETITGQWYADGEWLRGPYWDHFGDYASHRLDLAGPGEHHVWARIRNIGYHEPYRIDVTNQSGNLIRFDRIEQSYPLDGEDAAAWVKIGSIPLGMGEPLDFMITPLGYIAPGTYRGIHAFFVTTDRYDVPSGAPDTWDGGWSGGGGQYAWSTGGWTGGQAGALLLPAVSPPAYGPWPVAGAAVDSAVSQALDHGGERGAPIEVPRVPTIQPLLLDAGRRWLPTPKARAPLALRVLAELAWRLTPVEATAE